jgi:hypothetical protein
MLSLTEKQTTKSIGSQHFKLSGVSFNEMG